MYVELVHQLLRKVLKPAIMIKELPTPPLYLSVFALFILMLLLGTYTLTSVRISWYLLSYHFLFLVLFFFISMPTFAWHIYIYIFFFGIPFPCTYRQFMSLNLICIFYSQHIVRSYMFMQSVTLTVFLSPLT